MILLSIETSCDETAISILEITGDFPKATYTILGNSLFSQVDIHRDYGGVFPALAKREHIATILPMLERALGESGLKNLPTNPLTAKEKNQIYELLKREGQLAEQLIKFYETNGRQPINVIAVTSGPGLEPALWVGVNFAQALGVLWQTPIIPVDHMEGHILSSIFDGEKLADLAFPAVALLVSGGHTELILMRDWKQYEKIGKTRDDAVGEAFDKVARLLGLPYPGGPQISQLAEGARDANLPPYTDLPTPMLRSPDFDFSFSGLKTAVRYAVAGKNLTDKEKQALARDFEDATITVLTHKLKKAVEEFNVQSVIVGGGVSANSSLRQAVNSLTLPTLYPDLKVYLPDIKLSTDNSIMIALAGHANLDDSLLTTATHKKIVADGNRSL